MMVWKSAQIFGFFLLMNQTNIIINGEEYSNWEFLAFVGIGFVLALTSEYEKFKMTERDNG